MNNQSTEFKEKSSLVQTNRLFRAWLQTDVVPNDFLPPPLQLITLLSQINISFYQYLVNNGFKFDPHESVTNFSGSQGNVDVLFFDADQEIAVGRSYDPQGNRQDLYLRLHPNSADDLKTRFSQVGVEAMTASPSSSL